ncbi:hypothetical protein ABOM_011057 [Aspergillus bombycis]|uniref:Uncharacterized protein n=1 Tax=Aspergillus bombycis TaxID=109264 RepID=A0A1F7ZMB6_9EURO|nr:hypothetical protein ABOM_011057 [Aspergillus bombycis]OGM40572.1 hypothetical protein ABOM_011057 [Aspergillus bombycis]
MAVAIRSQQDKEAAETCLPAFGGGLGITWPPVCHVKDSSPPQPRRQACRQSSRRMNPSSPLLWDSTTSGWGGRREEEGYE